MQTCTSCSKEIPPDSKLCPYCGTSVTADEVGLPTVTAPLPSPAAFDPPSRSSSDSIDEARFTPGTMLTDRYRIVGMLGKGGMGEVFRADDLTLRQPVALKFLPANLATDKQRLERFHHEVRIARQVSHPNVCRVYDIGEADGLPFIAMEFVEGEDLASVLRRMGRPSPDKALEIARQLCAGLAAAHDKGVLHRDLKPHNVMIDERGQVRIADFGLAGFVEEFTGNELKAGTPAYMAPEQLEGREVSVRSDIYSLGLILSELFTGKRVTESGIREQVSSTLSSAHTSLSSLSHDIDPTIERVILRCLEKDPAARPPSALAVAAALPGGDPLAAALAAGETPSPNMVANAGDVGGLRPAIAIPCLLFILAGAVGLVATKDTMLSRVKLPKPPAVLSDRAAELLTDLGHAGTIVDTAHGFGIDWQRTRHVRQTDFSADRWDHLATCRPAPIYFWYRHSPRAMIPDTSSDRVTFFDPPLTVSRMASVTLDPSGRLTGLQIVPPQRDDSSQNTNDAPEPKWALLFEQAGLDIASFKSVPPKWTPIVYCDQRAAWEGQFPDQSDVTVRIEAGAYAGLPTFFKIISPWTLATRMEIAPRLTGGIGTDIFIFTLLFSVIVGSVLLARRNVRLRRGDRAGANRLAFVFFLFTIVGWSMQIHHVNSFSQEFMRLVIFTGWALVVSGTLWLLYMGLEPYVRRRWPQVLIGWTRLLSGRIRDPLVGRDMLIGGVAAIVVGILARASDPITLALGIPPAIPGTRSLSTLLGGRYLFGTLLDMQSIWFVLFMLFILFSLRVVLRRQWLAVIAVVFIIKVPAIFQAGPGVSTSLAVLLAALQAVTLTLFVLTLVRFGLVAGFSITFLSSLLFGRFEFTFDPAVWYSGTTFIVFAVVIGIYGFACHSALAGRSLFKDELLDS